MAIQNLSKVASLSGGDLIALFSSGAGGDAAATLTKLLEWIQANLAGAGDFLSQYETPTAGSAIYANPFTPGTSVFVLITPAATISSATFYVPALAIAAMGQEVLVHTTQTITALTVNGNGATVSGAPSTLSAGGFFRLRFDSINKVWYRVG